ncbi:hypothetical protein BU16DRAFT_560029 [Lophium mytilinum]|uniref:Uncharacterized protein n=1 Tax=Lophium mytilinum TaxID=390894 RepID=A0A6A6QZY2_9PEZI|nr:hypothetical protein BU16DRAFT_560029 [Lophium mytilinum]
MQRSEYIQGDYPQSLKDAVEVAGRKARLSQALVANALTSSPPTFVVMHEERYVYSSHEHSTVGVFTTIEAANAKVMAFFKEEHPDVVEEGNFFKGDENADLGQVTWKIDSLDALSLEYIDGGDCDFFKVHIKKQVLQN